MNSKSLEERSYRILDLISQMPDASQRDLAQSTGVSLGLINLTLRRLIKTGHIKIANLDKRKTRYNLTQKGIKEKAKRAYDYFNHTVSTFIEYQSRLDSIVSEMVNNKNNRFAVIGHGEVAWLIERSLKNKSNHVNYRFIQPGEPVNPDEVVLDCRFQAEEGGIGISILSKILKENHADKETAQ